MLYLMKYLTLTTGEEVVNLVEEMTLKLNGLL